MIVSCQRTGGARGRPGLCRSLHLSLGEKVRVRCERGFGGRAAAACVLGVLAMLPATRAPAASSVSAAALQPRTGYAFLLETGAPVYREQHEPRVEDGRLLGDTVVYRGEDGAVIARKHVDFAAHPLHPSFELVDRRTGYVEGLAQPSRGRVTLYHRKPGQSGRERRTLDAPEGLVADAGFDVLVFRHMEALRSGRTLTFPFAVPSRLDTIDFRLRRVARRRVLGREAVVIRMEPESMLLRWLVDPIEVSYAADTGRLLRYEGLSNIPDPARDGNYRVRIDFPPAGASPEPPEPSTPETGR